MLNGPLIADQLEPLTGPWQAECFVISHGLTTFRIRAVLNRHRHVAGFCPRAVAALDEMADAA